MIQSCPIAENGDTVEYGDNVNTDKNCDFNSFLDKTSIS